MNGDGSDDHPASSSLQALGLGFFPSPEGTRLAYTTGQNRATPSYGTVYTASSDGSDQRAVWHFVGDPTGRLAWNPAGTKIAFSLAVYDPASGQDGNPGLWVVNADGSDPHRVVADAIGNVAWSPDGKTLVYGAFQPSAFPSTPSEDSLDLVSAAGGRPRRLTSWDNSPEGVPNLSWAPDGRTILVTSVHASDDSLDSSAKIEAVSVPSGRTKVLFRDSPGVTYKSAVYSPDGSHIVVNEAVPGTTVEGTSVQRGNTLIVTRADGSHPMPLTRSVGYGSTLIGWVHAAPQLAHPPHPPPVVSTTLPQVLVPARGSVPA
ncbi:MAG: hypothetical protein M3137_19865, partial [Actinomycetota bacterium]|nr:hypothetical protein [Actinomycetota bacterium]